MSRSYAAILGLTQVAGATLLLFRKTTLLGAVMMLPVMSNILLINIFILVNDYGPYVISALICIALLIIIWQQRGVLVPLFWTEQREEQSVAIHRWIRLMIIVVVTTIMVGGALFQRHIDRVHNLRSSMTDSRR